MGNGQSQAENLRLSRLPSSLTLEDDKAYLDMPDGSRRLLAIRGGGLLLAGGDNCVNQKDSYGNAIDPISLSTFPIMYSIRLPAPNGSYYCFDSRQLLQNLKVSPRNPFTNLNFTQADARLIVDQLHKKYTWSVQFNSPFSHPPHTDAKPDEPSPWPVYLARAYLNLF